MTDTTAWPDPVHESEGNWWFWDETWAYRYGPYESREDAVAALRQYVKELDGDANTSS